MAAWYLKYRPCQVSELHLISVRQTLQHLMTSGRFPQALLFAGPKGTGKTSASRIIGAMLNDPGNAGAVEQLFLAKKTPKTAPKALQLQEPDRDSTLTQQICTGQSYAVIEIDAASHGLVDDVRALKDRAMLPPQTGLMTVYILDEVHMMSAAAFNALLKLLEEPPAHAVFILATTEIHKVPATIASRCTLVQFRKATSTEIDSVYERIVTTEGLNVESGALERLAELADGSFRDAVKWLELATTDGAVTVVGVEQLVGTNIAISAPVLINAVLAKDASTVAQILAEWRQQQVDPTTANRAVFTYLHQQLLLGLQPAGSEAAELAVTPTVAQFLLQQLLDANLSLPSPIPHLALELKLLELIQKSKAKQTGGNSGSSEKTGAKSTKAETPPETTSVMASASQPAPSPAAIPRPAMASAVIVDPITGQNLVTRWPEFVAQVALQNSSVAALLRQAQPTATAQGMVIVNVFYGFHRDQLKQAKFVSLFSQAAAAVVGQPVGFEFQLSATPGKTADTVPVTTPATAAMVKEVAAQPSQLASLASEVLM